MRSAVSLLRGLRAAVGAAEPAATLAVQAVRGNATVAAEATTSKASLAAAVSGVVAGVFGSWAVASANEVGDGMHTVNYPWPHEGALDSYDHASIRRGHQVYQQVCAACHSLQYVHWRQLVGVCYTEEETKALAAETEVEDGPDEEGGMFTRPGRLSDKFPSPYANEQGARFANGGAYPPDLSLITGARHNGQNYVFALLTGYREPPAGISVREGLHYNPYFPGGAIAMPKMLVDGGIEYDDGTPGNASQQAKDVVSFLTWTCYPYQDEMRIMGIKAMVVLTMLIGFTSYSKRLRWAPLKSQRIVMDVTH